MKARMYAAALLVLSSIPAVGIAGADGQTEAAKPAAAGLIGYWPLRGDCQDHSGNGLHGVNHGVRLEDAAFDGRGGYIEIPVEPQAATRHQGLHARRVGVHRAGHRRRDW